MKRKYKIVRYKLLGPVEESIIVKRCFTKRGADRAWWKLVQMEYPQDDRPVFRIEE